MSDPSLDSLVPEMPTPPSPPGRPVSEWNPRVPANPASGTMYAPWWQRPLRVRRCEAEDDRWIAAQMAALTTGCHIVAVCGASGGVGKTTVALTAGVALAEVPFARPIVMECLPDGGSMDDLLVAANPRGVKDLLHHFTAVDRAGIGMLQGFVTMQGRLPVLAAPTDPHDAARIESRHYAQILRLLSVHYNVIILDCGPVSARPVAQFAVAAADHLLVVGGADSPMLPRTAAAITFLTGEAVLPDHTSGDAESRRRDGVHPPTDCTLVVNGAGCPTRHQPLALARVRIENAALNAVVSLPHSPPLRHALASGGEWGRRAPGGLSSGAQVVAGRRVRAAGGIITGR